MRTKIEKAKKKETLIKQIRCPGFFSALWLAASVFVVTAVMAICLGMYSEVLTTLFLR